MTDKPRSFPLPLSSVVDQKPSYGAVRGPVATPQTATQNATQNARSAQPYVGRPTPAAPAPLRGAQAERELLAAVAAPRQNPLVSDAVRRAMVARVAKQGVKDGVVLAALERVPRHHFIDEALAAQAYIDASLPIGHHQTMSQPYIVARMIEVMRNGGQLKRVLEIGTGCGYQAAVLACVAQDVYSIERIKPLHELAKTNLRPMRVPNLRLHYGDGMLGLPQAAPFDGIILAAAGMDVPQALLEQLAIGGRLVAPVGDRSQHLHLVTRVAKAEWSSVALEDCHFVPLRSGIA
ncbi:MAG: protein-L-isoaspartate(D-aspartate) O-methyltransferase [Burkholderiaceae bacterium]|nr:protein-L-isoaspartate(D-aspartate) O-methyltransferase [Burkholderiaceae bacterium]